MTLVRNICSVMSCKRYKNYSNVSYFEGEPNNLDDIKSELSTIGKGSIDLFFHDDGIATLIINNPEKKNAFSGKMMAELCQSVEQLENWDEGKAVLISGAAGGGFCSGGDLDFVRASASPQMGANMSALMTSTLTRLRKLPMICFANIQPPGAIGGGAEVSVACDVRLINPKSKIGFVHARMGILPAWGGAVHLLETVGRSKALQLVSSGKLITAEESIAIGLTDAKVDTDQEAMAYVRKIVINAAPVVRAAKIAILNPNNFDLHSRLFASLFGGSVNRDALSQNIKHT